MAGAFRMALSRAKVTVTPADGTPEVVHTEVTATVRDGQAKARKYGRDLVTMPVGEFVQHAARDFTITGPDGTVWRVTKDCGCSGG